MNEKQTEILKSLNSIHRDINTFKRAAEKLLNGSVFDTGLSGYVKSVSAELLTLDELLQKYFKESNKPAPTAIKETNEQKTEKYYFITVSSIDIRLSDKNPAIYNKVIDQNPLTWIRQNTYPGCSTPTLLFYQEISELHYLQYKDGFITNETKD